MTPQEVYERISLFPHDPVMMGHYLFLVRLEKQNEASEAWHAVENDLLKLLTLARTGTNHTREFSVASWHHNSCAADPTRNDRPQDA